MKSCGFSCSRQTLIGLNVMYIVVALILIILPLYSKFSELLTSWPIIGGVIASGVFLLLVAIAGIYGSIRHNQIILFFTRCFLMITAMNNAEHFNATIAVFFSFLCCKALRIVIPNFYYMIVLILIFIILFAFSCAALAITNDQEHRLLLNGWGGLDNETKLKLEKYGDCCGFDDDPGRHFCHSQIPSELPDCCNNTITCEKCDPCYNYLVEHGLNTIKNGIGGVGMFFSFTLFVGFFLAFRYRHLKDPRANPSAFL